MSLSKVTTQTKPKQQTLDNRYQIITQVVSENPLSTAREIEMLLVKAKWVTPKAKRQLNYHELMRRLNECCVKGDKRECKVSGRDVTTWKAIVKRPPIVHPRHKSALSVVGGGK